MLDVSSRNSIPLKGGKTLGDAVRRLGSLFREAGIDTAPLDARVLAAAACGLTSEESIVKRDIALSAKADRQIGSYASRRVAGEPVSRIVGRREFWGLPFGISPGTLDPRPETELLVEAALDHVKSEHLGGTPLRILDLGTGSGCILGALLSELPLSFGVGLDRSADALKMARENLSRLGLLDRSALLCADWTNCLRDMSFDIIVCNPPYIASSDIEGLGIEVRAYDPRLALDGGEDGLRAFRVILKQVFKALHSKGFAVFEAGYGQTRAVLDMMVQEAPGGDVLETRILRDLGGVERAVAGVRQLSRDVPNSKKKIGNPVLSG
jgi:release factor glutamine methyltransferase